MYQIEKTVSIPASIGKYPFSEMQVGDSFFVPVGDATRAQVSNAASPWGKKHGRRFTVRTVDGGCRCWRVA